MSQKISCRLQEEGKPSKGILITDDLGVTLSLSSEQARKLEKWLSRYTLLATLSESHRL